MWVGTWNIGSLGGRGREDCDELRKKMVGVFAGDEMEMVGFLDAGDEGKVVQVVMVMKRRLFWWCWIYGE